jgi:hypothetical protein
MNAQTDSRSGYGVRVRTLSHGAEWSVTTPGGDIALRGHEPSAPRAERCAAFAAASLLAFECIRRRRF